MRSLQCFALGCLVASSSVIYVSSSGLGSNNGDASVSGDLSSSVRHKPHRILHETVNTEEQSMRAAKNTKKYSNSNNTTNDQFSNITTAPSLSPSSSPSLAITHHPTFILRAPTRSSSPAPSPGTNNTDDQDAYYYDVPLSNVTQDNDDDGLSYKRKSSFPSSSPVNSSSYYDVPLSDVMQENEQDEGVSYISKSLAPTSSPIEQNTGNRTHASDSVRSYGFTAENGTNGASNPRLVTSLVLSALLVVAMVVSVLEMKRRPDGWYAKIIRKTGRTSKSIVTPVRRSRNAATEGTSDPENFDDFV